MGSGILMPSSISGASTTSVSSNLGDGSTLEMTRVIGDATVIASFSGSTSVVGFYKTSIALSSGSEGISYPSREPQWLGRPPELQS